MYDPLPIAMWTPDHGLIFFFVKLELKLYMNYFDLQYPGIKKFESK